MMDEQNEGWSQVPQSEPGGYAAPGAGPVVPGYTSSGGYPPPPPGGYTPPPPGGYPPPPPPPPSGGYPPPGQPPYGQPPYGVPPVPPPPGEGLPPNTAAALSYLTFIPAVIFLVLDPYKRSSFVRFHAWQEIVLFCVWVVLQIIRTVLIFIPFLHLLIHLLFLLVGLAMFIFWLIAIIQASKGVRYKIPIVGDLAENFAGKM